MKLLSRSFLRFCVGWCWNTSVEQSLALCGVRGLVAGPADCCVWQVSVVMFGLCREGPIKITSSEFGASSRCVRWWARRCDARPEGRLKVRGQSGHCIKCWPSSRSSLAEASRGGCSWPPMQDLMWRPRPQGRLKRRWHLGQTTSVFPDVSSEEVACLLGHVFRCCARPQGRWNTRWQSGQTRSGFECGSGRLEHDFRCCASPQPRLNFRPQCWQVNLSAKRSVANTPVWTWTEESTTSSVSAGEFSRKLVGSALALQRIPRGLESCTPTTLVADPPWHKHYASNIAVASFTFNFLLHFLFHFLFYFFIDLHLRQDPLDLSFWSFLTFLHHDIEEVERHLLWKFYKKIRRKSWSMCHRSWSLA